jgi:hypothetical protein
MIYRLDHIGITVQSLAGARSQLESFHPCFHAQHGIEVRNALREVSLHRPARLSISLHGKTNPIGIELIEYPRVSARMGSPLPWWYDPEAPPNTLPRLKAALREQLERSLAEPGLPGLVALLTRRPLFNAVVVPVADLAAEEGFWTALRCERVHADRELAILGLRSLVPPAGLGYLILLKGDSPLRYHTDLEGINEIALLCTSCSTTLRSFPLPVWKSTVDTLQVDGKQIDLGYLRSPAGVLAELFSVEWARERRMSAAG